MRNRLTAVVFVSAALAGGCTTAGGTPATTPPVTATTTAPPATTTIAPATITVVEPETTTTLDRLAEIQAIFEDLERRRLQAIYDQDEAAFRSLYANDEYLERSMVLLDLVEFVKAPKDYDVVVLEVISDDRSCISALVETNLEGVTKHGARAAKQQTIELVGDVWGISYVGENWACDGPHPLSGS